MANSSTGFIKLREQLADSLRLVRQNQVWPDVCERLQDEPSPLHPRMRPLQFSLINFWGTEIKEVDVDLARKVARAIGQPAERLFQFSQSLQKLKRVAFV